MNEHEIIKTLTGVRIVRRSADGKYGIEEIDVNQPIRFGYRMLESALQIAEAISAENQKFDAPPTYC